ncbi:MAG: hypothetical protein LBD80_05730 [Tannerella sp.]|jgi:glycosyltransferase involved in cell wall biosynthesis|nr:hypothetical protein [Tannerella sp.]
MKVKLLLIIILAAVVSFTGTKAEKNGRRYEMSAGAGVWSTGNVAFILGDVFLNAVNIAGAVNFEKHTASPVYHVSCKYFPRQRFGIGVTLAAGLEKATGKVENQNDGNLKRFYTNMALEPSYYYLNRRNFKLYVLFGAGILYLHQDYTPYNRDKKVQNLYTADFQFTPLGIKVGNTLGAYLEGGIGYKGIVSLGAFYRF